MDTDDAVAAVRAEEDVPSSSSLEIIIYPCPVTDWLTTCEEVGDDN